MITAQPVLKTKQLERKASENKDSTDIQQETVWKKESIRRLTNGFI